MDSKELIEILGTDSISTSRIVINHNFKRLADELENYQEYFKQGSNNETFLSVDNVVSRKNDVINFKIGSSEVEPIVTINGDGLQTSSATVGDELTVETALRTNKIQVLESSELAANATLEEIENSTPNLLISTEYGNNGQTGNVRIKGNVSIEGNLSVTGTTPGGGGSDSTIMLHEYTTLQALYNEMNEKGYINFYNTGNIIVLKDNSVRLSVASLKKLVTGQNFNALIQYINKPIILTGRYIKLVLDNIEAGNPGYVSNGITINNEIVHPAVLNSPSYSMYFSAIKLSPMPVIWNNVKLCWLNIEILSAPLPSTGGNSAPVGGNTPGGGISMP